MSLTASEMTPADIAAVNGNNGGFGFGNDGAWIILFLFALFGGWGNNGGFGGGGNNGFYYTNGDIQRGFDQASVMNSLGNIQNAVSNGFAGAEVSRCNQQANLLGTLANNQMELYQAMNAIAMNQQSCCCENRAATADLKYTVATEACADRAAIGDALQSVLNTVNSGIQSLKDQMCNDKIDAKNEQIAALQNQLTMAALRESQTAQTAQLLADNARQTSILNPAPIPAYVVTRPCGCNGAYGFGYNG